MRIFLLVKIGHLILSLVQLTSPNFLVVMELLNWSRNASVKAMQRRFWRKE